MTKPVLRNLLIAVTLGAAPLAHADIGKIKICRYSHSVGVQEDKSAEIPAGSEFSHQGSAVPGRDYSVQYVIKTTSSAALGAKAACVVVGAKATVNAAKKPITVRAGIFKPQFEVAGLNVFAVVIKNFH